VTWLSRHAAVAIMPSGSILTPEGAPLVFVPERIFAGVAIAVVAAGVFAVSAWSLRRRDRNRLGPTTRRLCRALRVRRGDRKLLDRLAGAVGAPSAAPMLISRGCFDAAVARTGLIDDERRRVDNLRRHLFG
jgi:hypothetical protein